MSERKLSPSGSPSGIRRALPAMTIVLSSATIPILVPSTPASAAPWQEQQSPTCSDENGDGIGVFLPEGQAKVSIEANGANSESLARNPEYNPDGIPTEDFQRNQPAIQDDGLITARDIGSPFYVLHVCPKTQDAPKSEAATTTAGPKTQDAPKSEAATTTAGPEAASSNTNIYQRPQGSNTPTVILALIGLSIPGLLFGAYRYLNKKAGERTVRSAEALLNAASTILEPATDRVE